MNTTQSLIFELLNDYKTPEFKEAIKLIKKYPGENMIDHLWIIEIFRVMDLLFMRT